MSLPAANDDFDDELLSAFVDDELTAAERARVEERLRTDPRAVALVQELRELSSAVKSLPRETLPRDLRASVLSEVGAAGARESTPSTLPMPTSSERWSARRRGLVWSAMAIAAAILLTVLQPPAIEDGEVARRSPQNADQQRKRELVEAPREADGPARFNRESPSLKAPPTPAEPAAAPEAGTATGKDVAADRSSIGGGGGFGGGGGGTVGGQAGAPITETFTESANVADDAADVPSKEEERLLTPLGGAQRQSGEAEAPASAELNVAAGREDALGVRSEDATVQEAAGDALASSDEKVARKAKASVRVEEIIVARPDAVSRFKQLLVDNKIAVNLAKSPAASETFKLGVAVEVAEPEEILVDASAAQIEKLLAQCRTDKAFAMAPVSGAKQADAFYARGGLAGSSSSNGSAVGSLADDEAKSLSNQALIAEQAAGAAATSAIAKDKADFVKSPEPSTYGYGAPASAASPSATTRAATAEGREGGAGPAGGAARVQVLFRFLPPKSSVAKPAGK